MTPAQAIASLDNQLSLHGETIGWQITTAGVGAPATTHRAFVRGYKPDELVGGVMQGDARVILSPTGLTGVPKKGDKIVTGGTRTRNVQAVDEIRLADVLVRIELQVRG